MHDCTNYSISYDVFDELNVRDMDDFSFKTANFVCQDDVDLPEQVQKAINSFGVQGIAIGQKTGPIVAKVFFRPAEGVSVKKIEALEDDLKIVLGVSELKFSLAPEQKAVAIEIPVKNRQVVPFGNAMLANTENMALPANIGVDTDGNPVAIDIAKAPHLLIAGQTGSGKSVCVNSIILSLVMNVKPSRLKLILIDPKMVELTPYRKLSNLIGPIITDPKMAIDSLGWLVNEMETRYQLLADTGFRNIKDFNSAIEQGKFFNFKQGQARPMPYIVTVIDEFADLMMTASQELTNYVMRLAQKARAVGIHVILATQRPSVKVVTGDLKANIPARIAFKVTNATDSTTILGYGGAEKLLGNGDMIMTDAAGKSRRLHGGFLSDDELNDALGNIGDVSGNMHLSYDLMKLKKALDFANYIDPKTYDVLDIYETLKPFAKDAIWAMYAARNSPREKVAEWLHLSHDEADELFNYIDEAMEYYEF